MSEIKLPDDYEVEGQMDIYDVLGEDITISNKLIAVSKVFATAIKQMNLSEWKTFIYSLTKIKWMQKNPNIVKLDKKELADLIGIKSDSDHISGDVKRAIGNLPRNSFLSFENDSGWVNGCFITQVACFKHVVRVKFDDDYLSLFEELNKDKNYITMWSEDLFSMSSERSILLYEELRLYSDTRKTNTRIFSTKDFKQLFGIPKTGKGSYMNDGHFQRTRFETKVIQPLCDDLAKCRMINLNVGEDGKFYRKIKNKYGYVVGYEFSWTVSSHPNVASGTEINQISKEIDKDPQLLKVAKDIINGKKKEKKNSFNNFEQRNYNFAELEKLIAFKGDS